MTAPAQRRCFRCRADSEDALEVQQLIVEALGNYTPSADQQRDYVTFFAEQVHRGRLSPQIELQMPLEVPRRELPKAVVVTLNRQVQRRVSWMQIVASERPVRHPRGRHLPEHRFQHASMIVLDPTAGHLVVTDNRLEALLTDRA